jgi:putative phage-type endonuclease
MSYSIRNYIKKHCNSSYDLDDLNTISQDISTDSGGRYTANSALKIIVRYTYVENRKILFNIDSREPDMTLDTIKQLLISDNLTKTNANVNATKSNTNIINNHIINKKTIVPSVKKGFGVFRQLDTDTKIIKSIESNNIIKLDTCAIKQQISPVQTNLSKTIKKGFGVFKQSDIVKPTKILSPNVDHIQIPECVHVYTGSIRTDKRYGPYGTDNYHSDILSDDLIKSKDVVKRTEIFRDLNSRYYPPQRSEEWFKMRDEMITASDGGTIVNLNPYEQDFGFITKKVFGKPFETNEDCYHGKKFEQVATMVYEYRMNVKVKEFGLCQHKKYKFLGASPDGIVSEYKLKTRDGRSWEDIEKIIDTIDDPNDKREYLERYTYKTMYVGRMLEIKCPMRRKILMDESAPEVYGAHGEPIKDLKKDVKRGICPAYYWVQVQLQLQCCELDECDFWQCEIFEYADQADFLDDTDSSNSWLSRATGHEKGALIQLMPIEHLANKTLTYNERIYNFAQFIYQPRVDMTPNEIDKWILKTLQNLKKTHKGYVFESVRYWKVVNTRNNTIPRDDTWFNNSLATFERAWNCVEYLRSNKDKAKIIQKYISTYPLDYYKKIKEPLKQKGIIMNTILSIINEPSKDATQSEHKQYAKIIANVENIIDGAGIEEPKEYKVAEDIDYIRQILETEILDDIDEDEKNKQMKKFVEFVKTLKYQCNKYMFNEEIDD